MKMRKFMLLLVIVCILLTFSDGEFIALSQYHRMPKLWKMDDYDECLQSPGPEEPDGVYCTSTVVLKPDNRSDLWRLIEEFSSDYKRHLNHAVLKHGVCIQRCQKTTESLSPSARSALMLDKFEINRTYKFDETVFKKSATHRAMYEDMVEVCINKELNETYGLMAYAEVQFCDEASTEVEIDALDKSFLVILCLLTTLVIFSSWYDSSINYKRNPEHYMQQLDSKRKMLWVSFSIQRNWYRLTSRPNSQMHKTLRFFQAFRFLTMVLVVFGHAVLLLNIAATTHPEKFEMIMHNISSMILTNGVQITQTFLAMSGTLLAIQFLDFAEKHNGRVSYLYVLIAIVVRYIRLTPVYAFVMLFHATWLAKLQTGPLWRWGTETEQTYCRRNWWTNLLYINNYVHPDQPCVQQGWYLGAEFQIFIIAMLVLVSIVKFPRLKIAILTIVVAVAYTVPAIFIYLKKLEGTFVISLESLRYILWFDKFYLNAYIPTHINFGNYMLGVLTGLFYVELRKRSIDLAENRTFRVVWYLNFLVIPLSMLPSYMFYVNEFDKPSIWMGVYFALSKNLIGIGIGVLFLGSIYRVNKVLQRMLNYRFFEPMGRLAYGAYLSHAFVMRYMFVSARGLVYYSDLLTISLVAGAVVMSCLASLLLCLLIEFPTSAIQGVIFDGFMGRRKPNLVDPEIATSADQIPSTLEADAKKTDL